MKTRDIALYAGLAVAAGAIIWWQTSADSAGDTIDVKVPQLDQVAAAGQQLFSQKCASCHGANAGGSDKGPPLVHIYYEPNHHPDQAFYVAARIGVRQHHWRFGNMPPVEGISEPEVGKVIAYVRALQRANGIQ